jgi:Family of unknown function (DUF6502)
MTGVTRRKGRGTTRRNAGRARSAFASECLNHLARILVRSGHSPKDLARDFRAICRTLPEPTRLWDPARLHVPADFGQVISLWYSDPQYLDASGVPRGLTLKGRGISLESLISRALPGHEPNTVTRTLVEMRSIRPRNGLYFPTSRYVALRQDTARIRSLGVLMGILRTVERNVTGGKSAALLERAASHPNFPVRALPAFHQRLKLRAAAGDVPPLRSGAAFAAVMRSSVSYFLAQK